MKASKILFMMVLGGSLLSCGKAKKSDIEIDIVGSNHYLINAAAQSCTNKMAVAISPGSATPTQDISAHYFTMEAANISWKNTSDTAHIIQMKIDFNDHAILTIPCNISGDELLGVFYDYGNGAAWDGTIAAAADAATPRVLSSQCKLRCGSIIVPDDTKPFTAVGTLTLSGFQRSADGEDKPIKTTTTVRVLYE